MSTLDRRQQLALAVSFALFMALTRSHHFSTLNALPDASWAIFFAAGAYLRGRWVFPAFLALAAAIDAYAIWVAGVSSFCVTSAYPFLIPAYGALWAGGRWFAHRLSLDRKGLAWLAGSVVVSAFVAEIISSGSFYFLGERFSTPTLQGFLPRLIDYFPPGLAAMSFYVGVLAALHGLIALIAERRISPSSASRG